MNGAWALPPYFSLSKKGEHNLEDVVEGKEELGYIDEVDFWSIYGLVEEEDSYDS